MQAPELEQYVRPLGHTQAPSEQVSLGRQVLPQAPQLVGSVVVATQVVPHAVRPLAAQTHLAPEQV